MNPQFLPGPGSFDSSDPPKSEEQKENIIDLREQVVLDLTDGVLSGRETTSGPHVSGRPPELLPQHELITVTGGDRWMDAEAFVYERYVRVGFTAQSSRQQVEELARWSDSSRFHIVVNDVDDSIVGTIRSILGNYAELPVGQFVRTDFEDPDPLCELSSVVVDESVRSTGVLEHLFRAGWADAERLGASAIVGLVDTWLLEAFRHTYAMPFVPMGAPHYHMGGHVVPVTMSTRRPAMSEIARNNPAFWLWNLEALSHEEVERFDIGGLVDADTMSRLAEQSPSGLI